MSTVLTSHQAAARYDVTTQKLASWARRGWIKRAVLGTATYYDSADIEAAIRSRLAGPAPSNVTPISAALMRARLGLGIRKAVR